MAMMRRPWGTVPWAFIAIDVYGSDGEMQSLHFVERQGKACPVQIGAFQVVRVIGVNRALPGGVEIVPDGCPLSSVAGFHVSTRLSALTSV